MKTKFTQIFYSFVFILTMNSLCAQENFTDDTTDTAAPINDYLIPMLVLGMPFNRTVQKRVRRKKRGTRRK